jgi:isoquinoline 1-oxidoreductase beta subunit
MNLDRRRFITWGAGGALMLALGDVAVSQINPNEGLTPWIRLEPNGDVIVYSSASDIGQGSRTGQAQVLADELDVPWEKVRSEMAPDTDAYRIRGSIGTGGSRSIRDRFEMLRKAGATARAQLVAAAAARWGVKPEDCKAELGYVSYLESRKRLSYGELAADAAKIPPPAEPPLKDPSQWRYIGKPMAVPETPERVNGQLKYGIDVKVPGMLHASLRQCPVYGGTLVSVDEGPAMAIPGVKKVVKLPGAVAVIADKTWTAFKGVRALDPKWADPQLKTSSADMDAMLAAGLDKPGAEEGGGSKDDKAALRAAYAAAAKKVEATYEVPYLYHGPIEPMNSTVHVRADKVEVWSPTQVPTAVRKNVAKALGRDVDSVDLHVTRIGGGFGRRLQVDYAVLAALVAREVDAPVQLLWTREEDVAHDFYRARGKLGIRAALGDDGLITGYEMVGAATDEEFTGGAPPKPYSLKTWATTQSNVKVGVPTGAWRSVDPYPNTFVRESFIDECAHAAGADPLEYRRKLLGRHEKAIRALNTAAEKIGWGSAKAPGVGRGLALLQVDGWNTVVAHAIEVEVKGDQLKVRKIVVVADPNIAVNPAQAAAQAEGGTLMGLSAALGEQMTFTGAKADQANYDGYKVLRMRQAPPVEAIIISAPEVSPGGMGEPPVPGVAPALCNAVFDATGKRIRSLPLSAAGFKV